jgi:hypothetical protein
LRPFTLFYREKSGTLTQAKTHWVSVSGLTLFCEILFENTRRRASVQNAPETRNLHTALNDTIDFSFICPEKQNCIEKFRYFKRELLYEKNVDIQMMMMTFHALCDDECLFEIHFMTRLRLKRRECLDHVKQQLELFKMQFFS